MCAHGIAAPDATLPCRPAIMRKHPSCLGRHYTSALVAKETRGNTEFRQKGVRWHHCRPSKASGRAYVPDEGMRINDHVDE